jgi:hypothetical protein
MVGETYYKIKQRNATVAHIEFNGQEAKDYTFAFSPVLRAQAQPAVKEPMPRSIELLQNYPNPFNATTTVVYRLPQASQASLTIYDIGGREAQRIDLGRQDAGEHKTEISAAKLASGTYFYVLSADGVLLSKRMTVVK